MKRMLISIKILFCFMISTGFAVENVTVSPDLIAIQNCTVELVKQHREPWWENFDVSLNKIDIQMVRRADDLLTNTPLRLDKVNPLGDKPVYLVHAVSRTSSWKADNEHVLIIQLENDEWSVLFHFSGGWNGKGIEFKIIDLGTSTQQFAILVEDFGCGNQMSQTRTHIVRYDNEVEQFIEIFNELTTWLPSVVTMVYESTLSFEQSDSPLKDIMVYTKLIKQEPIEIDFEKTCISKFHWDGEKYSGKMDLPIAIQE